MTCNVNTGPSLLSCAAHFLLAMELEQSVSLGKNGAIVNSQPVDHEMIRSNWVPKMVDYYLLPIINEIQLDFQSETLDSHSDDHLLSYDMNAW